MKYNILYYYSYDHLNTGSPTVLVNMIKGLGREKYKPFFLSPSKGPLIDALAEGGVEILEHEAKSISYKSPFTLLFRAYKFAGILKANDIKLLHINDYVWNLDLALGAWMARIPIISHLHNRDTIEKRNFLTHISDWFLFVSENHKNNVKNFELIENKSSVLYNAIDYKYYGSGKNIRAALGYSQGDILVGTISQIAKHKGIDILCETAKICCQENDNIKFLVVGPIGSGEEDFYKKITESIEKNNLSEKIKLIGPRKDIADFLASIDIFLLPSREETFGLVIGEALSAGLPVITSRAGGIPEIIKNPDIGLMIDSENPDEYAREILKEVSKDHDKADMRKPRIDHIKKNFSVDYIYEKLDSLYMSLIN